MIARTATAAIASDRVPAALAMALTAGRWWLVQHARPGEPPESGWPWAERLLAGGPVAQTVLGVLWAVHRLLVATDALGDSAKALDRSETDRLTNCHFLRPAGPTRRPFSFPGSNHTTRRRNAMSTAMLTNGKPRKQLSDQLDRLDEQLDKQNAIIDALSEGLNGAVADAAKEGVKEAVKAAVIEMLTDPELRVALHKATAPAVARQTNTLAANPRPESLRAWPRSRASRQPWLPAWSAR